MKFKQQPMYERAKAIAEKLYQTSSSYVYINRPDFNRETGEIKESGYFSIKDKSLDVTFCNGRIHQIEPATFNDDPEDSYLYDIPKFLDVMEKIANGEEVVIPPTYAITGNEIKYIEKRVEVDNPEHKVKSDILDNLLNRKISID